jgi:hypothetical protein
MSPNRAPAADGALSRPDPRFQLNGETMRTIPTAAAALGMTLAAGCTQPQLAAPGTAQATNRSGVNVGSLSCNVAGGVGFVFGSSRTLNCLFTRTDGIAERYEGTIRRYGVDVGFTRESSVVWLVLAPGSIAPGAIAGEYAGATAQGTVGIGVGANVLLGGSNDQITLQPVSVEGSVGLNAAAGVAALSLRKVS